MLYNDIYNTYIESIELVKNYINNMINNYNYNDLCQLNDKNITNEYKDYIILIKLCEKLLEEINNNSYTNCIKIAEMIEYTIHYIYKDIETIDIIKQIFINIKENIINQNINIELLFKVIKIIDYKFNINSILYIDELDEKVKDNIINNINNNFN